MFIIFTQFIYILHITIFKYLKIQCPFVISIDSVLEPNNNEYIFNFNLAGLLIAITSFNNLTIND